MSDPLRKYPDESEIQNILDRIRDTAWKELSLSNEEEGKLIKDLKWVLDIWHKKYLGHDRLTQVIDKYYLSALPKSQDKVVIYKELDLVICFFQHYIYAFEEFMTRESIPTTRPSRSAKAAACWRLRKWSLFSIERR